MAWINVPFYQGWIKSKDDLNFTENFSKIINFYVFGTPCEFTSSSGRSIRDRKWDRNTWKRPDLRTYILSMAELKRGVSYAKAITLDEMADCAVVVGLSGNFQTIRDKNRVVFYSDKRTADILSIFFYIRCSFAHGRFEIYNDNNGETIYAIEAIEKRKGITDCIVKARMILKESTLILWANTIMGGEVSFAKEKKSMEMKIQNSIMSAINKEPSLTKARIVESIGCDDAVVYKQIKVLTDNRKIVYDRSKKIWQCT